MGNRLRLTLKNDSLLAFRLLRFFRDCCCLYVHNIEEMAAEVSFLCNLYAIISERRLIQDSNIGVCV